MTRDEFDEWLAGYAVRFKGVANMMSEDPTIASDWFSELGAATVEQITTATRDIMTRDPQPFPADHLGKLRAVVKSLQFEPKRNQALRYTSEPSYRCIKCLDRGHLWVWHPSAYKAVRDNTLQPTDQKEIVVACDCNAATPGLIKFDHSKMLPSDTDLSDLIEFVETIKPRNYYHEFAEFA